MPSKTVIIGAEYRHDITGDVMKLEAASVPELENNVSLVEPSKFLVNKGFIRVWRGTWDEFLNQWTQTLVREEENLTFNF